MFIGYDVGGTLIKAAAVLSQRQKYKEIHSSIRTLVFLGCPHMGPKFDLVSGCSSLLTSHMPSFLALMWDLAMPLADWILDTNHKFAESRFSTLAYIINLVSSHPDPKQRVFAPSIASMRLPFETLYEAKRAHEDLGKHLPEVFAKVNIWDWRIPSDSINTRMHIRHFVSQIPPQHPTETLPIEEYKPECRASINDLQGCIKGYGAHLRLIDTSGDSASQIAEHLYTWVHASTDDSTVDLTLALRFIFNSEDCRYESAEAMLHNGLAELCCKFPRGQSRADVENAVGFLSICRDLHLEDLYATFVDILLQILGTKMVALDHTNTRYVIVLGNLDNDVRNGMWLFRRLQETISDCELNVTILVTSSNPASLTPKPESIVAPGSAQSHPAGGNEATKGEKGTHSLAPSSNRIQEHTATVHTSIMALVQKRKELFSHIKTLFQLAESCGRDKPLWRMVINWLNVTRLPMGGEISGFLSQLLPVTPNKIFKSILMSINSEQGSTSKAFFMVECVLVAFRPLTLSEVFDFMLGLLDWENQSSDGIPDIPSEVIMVKRLQIDCGGLLTVRRGEVVLGHSELRNYLLTSQDYVIDSLLLHKSENLIHKKMAENCLSYMSSSDKRKLMQPRASGSGSQHTTFECRDDFLSYAVKYWLRHAKHAVKEGIFKSEACKNFLMEQHVIRLWSTLYLGMSPSAASHRKVPCERFSCLSIFAEHEAEELLEIMVTQYQPLGSTILSSAFLDALVAAAGVGNVRMIKLLMNTAEIGDEVLDRPILAAIESGNIDALSMIINSERKNPGRVKDLTTLLARAASLGRTAAVRQLLLMIRTSGSSIDISKAVSPLSYACQRGFLEIVELLFRDGVSIFTRFQEHAIATPVKFAVKFGHLTILKALVSRFTQLPEDPQTIQIYRRVIYTAGRFGMHTPIQYVLSDMQEMLSRQRGNFTKSEQSVSEENREIVALYLAREIVGVAKDERDYATVVKSAIQFPSLAMGVIDVLTIPNDQIKESDFPSVFTDWLRAAVLADNPKLVRLVFENGSKAPWATIEVLRSTATEAFSVAINYSTSHLPFLIEKGADIASPLANGATPLYHAVSRGSIDVVKILIEAKVDVNAIGIGAWYPIHGACSDVRITRMLLAAGADVNVLGVSSSRSNSWSALGLAVLQDSGDVVAELLEANLGRESLRNGLETASEAQSQELVEAIMPYCPDASYLPSTILHLQVRHSNLQMLKLLLGNQYKIDPNMRGDGDNTPLHYISRTTSIDVVDFLIQQGANMEFRNKYRETPLTIAIRETNHVIVKYLIDHESLSNIKDSFNSGPFHLACFLGTLEMVKILHDSRANLVNVDLVSQGYMGTPLMAALRREESEEKQSIVRYLLEEANAQVNLASPYWGSPLHLACLTSTPETMLMLIGRGADVNVVDRGGRTPLHFALYRTREHVELLLQPQHGADLDAVDALERHALHFAVLSGRLDLVMFVLKKRPNLLDKTDAHGWTPLMWALRRSSLWQVTTNERAKIVKELINHGARRAVHGNSVNGPWSPLTLASYYDFPNKIISAVKPTSKDLRKLSESDRDWPWKYPADKLGVWAKGFCDHCLLVR
ncbi:ankyrin repeat-containing domain protein [Bombardia bombarda]|uniref:Ankyrin repeat-containing domain protein n=1 Tax=Bombardia bombarda TaxID=252184 RepID=A0AA39XNA9_9PEZI|nr:ankyrin repeat-containing domain protein [Bombardia bombarda]